MGGDAPAATAVGGLSLSNIENGSIDLEKLNDGGASEGSVLTFNGESWEAGDAAAGPQGWKSLPGTVGLVVNSTSSGNNPANLSVQTAILTDSTGNAVLHSNLTYNLSLTSHIDTGSPEANTWYYMYIISNGQTARSLFSKSSATPVLPNGFTYKILVSALKTDADGNFLAVTQRGKLLLYDTQVTVLSEGYATAFTEVELNTGVPPIAQTVEFKQECFYGHGSSQSYGSCALSLSSTGPEAFSASAGYWGNGAIYEAIELPLALNLKTAQKIYYKNTNPSAYHGVKAFLRVRGFHVPGNLN